MPAYRKRRVYFIEPSFQLRFISRTFLFILVGSLITAGSVYYTAWSELGDKLAAVYPQGRLLAIFTKVNLQVLASLVLALPILLYISMRISHRIAGPIYRIKKELAEIAKGRLDTQVKLRQRDEMQDVAQSINQMLAGLRSQGETKHHQLEKIQQQLVELQKNCSNGGSDPSLVQARLSEVIANLGKIKGEL